MSASDAPSNTLYGYTPAGKDSGVVKSKGKPTLHLGEGAEVIPMRARKPEWLKVRAPGGPNYLRLQQLMRIAAQARPVTAGGSVHVKRLMRPDMVVFLPETIEAVLLGGQ